MSDVFKYVKSINTGSRVEVEHDYNKFLTNRAFSYHLDTVVIANEINKYPECPSEMQYDFLAGMISPSKRWSKWHKPKTHKGASLISVYYNIPLHRAYSYLPFFSEEDINEIAEQVTEK